MEQIAVALWLLPGFMLGLLLFSFLLRWVRSIYAATGRVAPGSTVSSGKPSLFPATFVVINPAPWIIIALPFVMFHVLSVSHAAGWPWFFGGLVLGPVFLAAMVYRVYKKTET